MYDQYVLIYFLNFKWQIVSIVSTLLRFIRPNISIYHIIFGKCIVEVNKYCFKILYLIIQQS